jgi:peroxiredoxin
VKSWASSTLLGAGRRSQALRAALAVALVGALVWALPVRRPGEEGAHHAEHAPVLDPFEKAGVTELLPGHRTPELRLPRLDGGVGTLGDHRARLVLVNFWATWCTPCTAEMPTLEALWREYRGRGLVVLAVSVDRDAPRALLEPYVARLGLSFPILLDADMKVSRAWRVTGVPATFVVRPGGEAVGMAMGAREWNSAQMRALLESLLPHGHAHR